MKRKAALIAALLCAALCIQLLGGCGGIPEYAADESVQTVNLLAVPEFSGEAYIELNGNRPRFTEEEITQTAFEQYAGLDRLGRCGTAFACIGQELMPDEERGYIGSVKPTGWQISKYDFIDGKYLYNRCHLIGYQLTGENANERNLITGTRFMNTEGMLPFENLVADYIKETDNHVMYRVIPVFKGDNLVAHGVLMEAESVEDKGEGVSFCVYCYNNQPWVKINYADGSNSPDETAQSDCTVAETDGTTYVINISSRIIHLPSCRYADQISSKNKQIYKGDIAVLLKDGYEGCKVCNP